MRGGAQAARPTRGLTLQPNPLIGREADLNVTQGLLLRGEVRLVTITGPPGVGKTKLAVALASTLEREFDDGVAFVDLAPVSTPALVLQAMADALGIPEEPGRPLLESLKGDLRELNVLLVLDNFEHVVTAGAEIGALLMAAADIKMLVTSREPLHVSWEYTYALAPLALPGPTVRPDHVTLAEYPATALFVDRARAADSGFSVDPASAPVITTICRKLDGLPLAIEIAAAWVNVLRPEEILSRLEQRPESLTVYPRELPERHRTLAAAISWSYGLLSETERTVFRRFGVFAGGASLEALEAVCVDLDMEILAPVASLVDKSLLLRVDGGETRFSMLETLREAAVVKLQNSGEASTVRSRHAAWLLGLAERAWRLLWSEHQDHWLARLDREYDNIRAALRWSLSGEDEETGVRLAAFMSRYWFVRDRFREAQQWLESAVRKHGVANRARAHALAGLTAFLVVQGEAARAIRIGEDAIGLSRLVGDPVLTADALLQTAIAAWTAGDPQRAELLFREMLVEARSAADDWLTARALSNLGLLLHERGDDMEARRALEESLLLARPLHDKWLLSTVTSAFGLALTAEDPRLAQALLRESLALGHETGHQLRVVRVLESLAGVLVPLDSPEDAVVLLGRTQAVRDEIGSPRDQWERSKIEQTSAAARRRLGAARFEGAWTRGKVMTTDEAVALALGRPAPASPPRGRRPGGLTGRETQIAVRVARGSMNREIAEELGISERTVDTHVQNILNKLGVDRRAQIAAWAAMHLSQGTVN